MDKVRTLGNYSKEIWDSNADQVRALYKHAIRPIYGRHPSGRPDQVGTGVLVEIGGQKCLATAAHVLDLAPATSLHLGTPPNFLPMNLTFEATEKIDGDRSKDHVDVALARLDAAALAATKDLPFIPMSAQWVQPQPTVGRCYLVMGFRSSQNKLPLKGVEALSPTIWTYKDLGTVVPRAAERLGRGEHNIAVAYGRRGRRQDGQIIPNTAPRGVSGGAIFDLGSLEELDLLNRGKVITPRLAGIFIEATKKVLIGTHISVLHTIVAATRQELELPEDDWVEAAETKERG